MINKSEVLRTVHSIYTLAHLKDTLQKVSVLGVHDTEVYVIGKDGGPLTLKVVEDTLSDGSRVINYIIS
jgi:hypothetical protein